MHARASMPRVLFRACLREFGCVRGAVQVSVVAMPRCTCLGITCTCWPCSRGPSGDNRRFLGGVEASAALPDDPTPPAQALPPSVAPTSRAAALSVGGEELSGPRLRAARTHAQINRHARVPCARVLACVAEFTSLWLRCLRVCDSVPNYVLLLRKQTQHRMS